MTPDGRYFVVAGKLWRMSNPQLEHQHKAALVQELMEARRAVKNAKSARDQSAEAEAHHAVDTAKRPWESVGRSGGTTASLT